MERRTLGSFCSFKYGKMPEKNRVTDDASLYPIFSGYRIVGYYDESNIDEGELIVVARGVGGTGDVKLTPAKCYLTNLSIAIDVDEEVALKQYLYYYFQLTNLRYLDSGSAQSQITISDLHNVDVPIPSMELQRNTVATLRALDDKIANNTKINNHLEQMAQAIWSERFGGCEPNGVLGDIIELFDFKRIPLSGNQRDKMEKIYPYYGAATLMDYVDNYLFDGIYLLLGEDGTVIDDLGFPTLQYVWGKFWVNNHAHILQARNGFTVESLYTLLKQTSVTSIVTGAVQPKINQANLKALAVSVPSEDEMREFNDLITPLFAQIRENSDENLRLAELRDALLPKLMSGELSVADLGEAK